MKVFSPTMYPATGPFERSFVVKVCGTFKLPYVLDVADTRVEVGLLASREVASLVSGLRSMSTILPISMESLMGSRNSLMRSIVDVGDEVDLFVLVLSFVLMLLISDIGVGCFCAVEVGLWVGGGDWSGGVCCGGSVGCCWGGGGGGGGGGCCCMPSALRIWSERLPWPPAESGNRPFPPESVEQTPHSPYLPCASWKWWKSHSPMVVTPNLPAFARIQPDIWRLLLLKSAARPHG